MSHIEETNEALERHLARKRTQDAIVAVLCGLAFGALIYFILGTGGPTSSGGISPTMSTSEGWPLLGTAAGIVGGVVVARFAFTGLRQRRRRRFWGL